MYAPPEESINNCDNDSEDSNVEDEDELTRIISPEGTFFVINCDKGWLHWFLVEDTKDCLKARHILGILGFLGFANVYAMRVNLSVAIVAMVNGTVAPVSNGSTFDHCPVPNVTNNTEPVVSIYKSWTTFYNAKYLFIRGWNP